MEQHQPVQLHAIRHGGPGPARFLLVHGLASCARLWDGVGTALAARGHAAVAVDLRGHGESPKPEHGYGHDSVTADLLPFLEPGMVVAGQSYGANVAVALAARPDARGRVAAVACVDGGAIDLPARFPTLDDALAALRPPYELFEGRPVADAEVRLRAMHPDWPEISIQGALAVYAIDREGRIHPRLSWERHRQIIRAMWESPPSVHWSGLDVPVLFLMATSRMRPAVDAAVAALPAAEAVWFDGADHDLHAQRPDEVADRLVGLLPAVGGHDAGRGAEQAAG